MRSLSAGIRFARFRTLVAALVPLFVASAVGAQTLAPALEAGTPKPGKIRIAFEWAPPCRVPTLRLTQKSEGQPGPKSAFVAFDLVVAEAGPDLEVRMENPKLLLVEGVAAEKSPLRAGASLEFGVATSFVVSREGKLVRAGDVDRAIDEALLRMPLPAGDPMRAKAETYARSPPWRASLRNAVEDQWRTWIGEWVGLEVAPETPIDRVGLIERRELGMKAHPKEHIVDRGPVAAASRLVLIDLVAVIDGDEGRDMMNSTRRMLGMSADYKIVHQETRLTAAIDPRTGRPHRVRKMFQLELEGQPAGATVTDTAFDWSHATGCRAR